MSTGNRQSPLGKLPLPRSPAALDEKILDYARQQAPQPSKQPKQGAQWRSGWITGMATAGIVAIAVFIADPQLLAPRFEQRTPQVEEAVSTALQRDVRIASKTADERTFTREPMAERARALMANPTIKAKPAAKTAPMEQDRTLADEAFAAGGIVSDPLPSGVVTAEGRDSADAAALSSRGLTVAREELTALKLTGERRHAEAEAETVEHDDSGSYAAETAPTQLRQCIALLQAADKDGARACYQALRQRCSQCELPPSLQQAIAELAEQAATPPE